MNHAIDRMRGEDAVVQINVAKVSFDHLDARFIAVSGDIVTLEPWIVVVVEIIDDYDGVVGFRQKEFGEMAANEAGPTGD
jgi:hypothetical protein